MPLSEPPPRERIHSRTIECRGYRRADGLWDIEGHLIDRKTYSFENRWRGTVEAGAPVHEMWLRLTIDEDMVVHRAEAATDHAPYRICAAITPQFERLKGERIGPGWNLRVRKLLGGVHGCTHHVELLGPLATVAYQTLVGQRKKRRADGKPGGAPKKPRIIDSCHAYASDGPVVKEAWPEFYSGS